MPTSVAAFDSKPEARHTPVSKRLMVGLTATLAIAAAAHVALPLPFTPVPFTLQPLAVLVVGLLLGPIDGTLTLLAYLAEGATGLPVFSPTGPGALPQLLGPTGGYLLAYPLVAFVAGVTARRTATLLSRYGAGALGGLLATVLLFSAGAGWLAHLHVASGHGLWLMAVEPFLPGEAIKILIAAAVYRTFSSSFSR